MVIEWLRFALCAFFILCGLFTVLMVVIGIYRFKDPLCTMHAAAMVDTMGLLCFVIASGIAFGFGVENIKMVMVVLLMWQTSPVNSHLLSRLEYITGGTRGGEEVSLPEESLPEEKEEATEEQEDC